MTYTTNFLKATNDARNLQKLYLSYFNDFLTVEKFAEAHNLTTADAHDLIKAGKTMHDNIASRVMDERYDVAYARMGPDMHNYQSFARGIQIGYALSQDEAWAQCAVFHIHKLANTI